MAFYALMAQFGKRISVTFLVTGDFHLERNHDFFKPENFSPLILVTKLF